jgi:integrase/recombinase XerD
MRNQPKINQFEEFIEAKRAEGVSKSTINVYTFAYKRFNQFVGNQRITPELVRKWVVWLMDDCGLSQRTAYDYLKLMRTYHDFKGESDSFNGVKNVKHTQPDIDLLTVEEVRVLLRVPNQRYYADFRNYVLMHFLLDAMPRINEAVNIRQQDIDRVAKTVTIRASTSKVRRPRIVPISGRTTKLLFELIADNAEFNSDYVFLANHGGRLSPNQFRKVLRKYAERAGLSKRVNPHLFRHTGATMYLEAGGDLRHLQLILGHNDVRMVQRYTHLTTQSVTKQHAQYSAINAVEEALNKPRKIRRK